MAVAAQQHAVVQIQAQAAHGVGLVAVIADGDVDGVLGHHIARQGVDAFEFAGDGGQRVGGRECSGGNADADQGARCCAVLLCVDQCLPACGGEFEDDGHGVAGGQPTFMSSRAYATGLPTHASFVDAWALSP